MTAPMIRNAGTMDNHFLQRCRERGLADVAEPLYWDLRIALSRLAGGIDVDGDYLEKVFDVPAKEEQRAIYRFNVNDQIHFALVAEQRSPITLLTPDMVQKIRKQRKAMP